MAINCKNGRNIGVLALSLTLLVACTAQSGVHPYDKTNHFRAQNANRINHNPGLSGRYGQMGSNPFNRGGRYGNLRGPAMVPPPGPGDMFQQWIEYEPVYTLYPGDQIDVVVQSAPELSRTLTVGPDGRISMPNVPPIMAAGRSLPQIQAALRTQLAKELRDPTIAVTSRSFAPMQIYVGGQVGQQGQYTLTGPIGSLEAIMMAGGFLPTAKSKDVVILRRAPNGRFMMRTVNHKQGLRNVRAYGDNMQLRRGDIVFVPRNSLSEVGVFVQQLRQALPIDMSLSYNLGNGFSGN